MKSRQLVQPPATIVPEPPVRVIAFPSTREGLGAIPYEGGVAFRVWAPFANAVYVAGTFNIWKTAANPLADEGNGYWSCDIAEARVGHHYKYVITNGARTLWKNDPYARDVTSSIGNTIITAPQFEWTDDNYRTPAWHELVVYELHAGTFNDRPGGRPGSFRSVMRKLDYLRELGVNAIELMPAMEFAADFSWGYNPSNIFAIESAYGGPRGLKRLVRAAHHRGIAVIFDGVYNHFGPDELDLWQFDGWNENDKGGIYFYNDERSETPWGDTRPDYGRPAVRDYIRDNVRYWLEECHIDGLRWDATAWIRNRYGNNDNPAHDIPDGWSLMRSINDETDARQPWKLHIAEDLRDNEWITRSTANGGAGFDTQWDSEFVHPLRAALITRHDEARDMHQVRDAIVHRYGADAFARVIYTESHDEVANGKARLPEEIWPGNAGSWASRKRSTLGAGLLFTSPGIPMLFQGQEFLEDAWFRDEDPLDWTRAHTFTGILHLYRDLIRLRRNWYDNTRGLRGQHVNVFHLNDGDKLVAFHRWENGGPRDDVIVVANFANRAYDSYTIGLPCPGVWRVRLNSDWEGYGADFGNHFSYDTLADGPPKDGLPASGNVGIGPYSIVIMSQE
jgi:1,4-alpha-glucan branching enzyme